MNLLRSFFKGKTAPKDVQTSDIDRSRPNPTTPYFVVGDLHGTLDLLEHILEQIDHVIGTLELRDPKLVFVGDYIDRGQSSAAVLTRLHELNKEFPENVTCILGNHEQMMLDFLDAPEARHARWFRNGATETLASFGILIPFETEWATTANSIAEELRSQLGDEMEDWLRNLPASVSSGNLMITHAGVDPGRAINDQSSRVLLWGHPEFLTRGRTDGQWVAHGHTIMERAVCEDGRISVDTGGYATGCLTAAVVLPDGTVEFLQTTQPRQTG
ncbi:serine/threonine protein phosphatase 1 [Litoreibacter meonggei]|uniref:Serine/threonine protein phosphatase 1 n=1 Tax=Litoreibacter meonggei TaxID=1049199 RepID=A0A497W7P7_9RHOB|nr:metallophosphoesterase family protein [Litoreibacter meonggei]RLJ52012.1 serine/threonine protein phosphatase 1 [Litoreibacter meonggei]